MNRHLPHYDFLRNTSLYDDRLFDAKNGGKGSSPAPVPPPAPAKAQVQKPVGEATTVARDAQKERAAKASGIRGSILTDPMGVANTQQQGKTLLGQ